ncbi:MAG: sensor histidine kinase [Acidimicrobiales bacterium]
MAALAASTLALSAYGALGYPASPVDLAVLGLLAWVVGTGSPRAGGLAVGLVIAASGMAAILRPGHDASEIAGVLAAPVVAGLAGLVLRGQRQRSSIAGRERDLALEEARLAAERSGANERLRIARNMHDAVGHGITRVTLQVEAAERVLATDPERARAMLVAAADCGREAMQELHALLTVLRAGAEETPALGGGQDLPAIVGSYVDAGLPTELDTDGTERRLPAPVAEVASQVVAEALSNVAKHAGAHRARVSLHGVNDCAVIEVADDGRGPGGARLGLGLTGTGERIEALGGRLELRAGPGGGALLRAELPLRPGGTGRGELQEQ